MRCKYCRRKIGKSRKKGTLDYVLNYASDPNIAHFACINCAKQIKASLKAVEPLIRSCFHNPGVECYEPTSTRIQCLMLTQGWTVSKILCPHAIKPNGSRSQEEIE